MIEIYIDNLKSKHAVLQEIRYLNYLVNVTTTFDNFFAMLGKSGKELFKYRKKLTELLTDSNTILVPRTESLAEGKSLSFKERWIMSKPERLLQHSELLEEFYYVFTVKDANLTDLDTCFAKLYRLSSDNTGKDQVIILNSINNTRLHLYKDLVFGLDSKRYIYKEGMSFKDYMQKALTNLSGKNKHLRKLMFLYSIGTTAISPKSFGI